MTRAANVTPINVRAEMWGRLGKLFQRVLERDKQSVRDADNASRAPYLPSNPQLMRAIARSLLAAQRDAEREYDRSPKCVSCDRPSPNRLCSQCKEIA